MDRGVQGLGFRVYDGRPCLKKAEFFGYEGNCFHEGSALAVAEALVLRALPQ